MKKIIQLVICVLLSTPTLTAQVLRPFNQRYYNNSGQATCLPSGQGPVCISFAAGIKYTTHKFLKIAAAEELKNNYTPLFVLII